MRVKATFGFCALICLLGWADWRLCLCFLTAMLCHECGHLLVARSCGIRVEGISLGLGGAVIFTESMTQRQEILCAAGGPTAGILLGIAVVREYTHLGLLSLGLSVVNLLPIYPLDGGRILRAVLSLCVSEENAYMLMKWITFFVCGLLMLAACWWTVEAQAGVWPMLAAAILLSRAGEANLRDA